VASNVIFVRRLNGTPPQRWEVKLKDQRENATPNVTEMEAATILAVWDTGSRDSTAHRNEAIGAVG
jgi:hypothetical protein